MLENIKTVFIDYGNSFFQFLPNIALAILVMVVFIVIGRLVNRIFRKRIEHHLKDKIISSFTAQVIKWTFTIIGIILALDILGFGKIAASIVAGAGISAIIFGFAFKDIAENFLAGILLAINRPFNVGDIIEVSGIKGPVKTIDFRSTHIRTVDGRDIFIPNSNMIKDPLTNYTSDGYIRLEFMVGLDQNDDVEKARTLIIDHLDKQEGILKTPEPNAVIEGLGVSSIDIKVYFWVDLFNDKVEDQVLIGEPIRSQNIREIKDLMIDNGFNLPSVILEHKIYQESHPFPVIVKPDNNIN